MDQKLQLEEQLRAVMDKYKYKRRQIRELNDDLQVIYGTNTCVLLSNTIKCVAQPYMLLITEKYQHIVLYHMCSLTHPIFCCGVQWQLNARLLIEGVRVRFTFAAV